MKKILSVLIFTSGLAFLSVTLASGNVAVLHSTLTPHIEAFMNYTVTQIPVGAMLLGIGIVGFAGIQR